MPTPWTTSPKPTGWRRWTAAEFAATLSKSVRGKLVEQFAHPFDHDARCGIALEMILHQQPDFETPRQQRGAKTPVRQQRSADMLGQDSDRLMRLHHLAYHAKIIGDAAASRPEALSLQKRHLRGVVEIVGVATDHRPVAIDRDLRLEQIEADVRELGDGEVALLRLAQPNRQVRFPAGEIDVLP